MDFGKQSANLGSMPELPQNVTMADMANPPLTIATLRQRVADLERAMGEILPAAENFWDEGPGDEGWQSRKLADACQRARDLLSK